MGKWRISIVFAMFVSVLCMAAYVPFDGGWVEVGWENTAALVVRICLDDMLGTADDSATWVVTNLSHRFQDGVFAWQIHYSEEEESVIVIPNDFLMVHGFDLSHLGIDVLSHETGRELTLRIPRDALIPNLVSPSDLLEIHALWRQMEPIAVVAVPDFGQPFAIAGSGGEIELAETCAEELLPTQSVYVVGEPIDHCFVVIDSETGEPDPWATAYCEIVRCSGNRGILAQFEIPRSSETGAFELLIETSGYAPGNYDLCIWGSAGIECKRIEIREP